MLATLGPERSYAQQDSESDPRGAVLCIWMIYSSLHAIGQTCEPQADRDFQDLLEAKIDEMDAFIIRNSETTQPMLDTRRQKLLSAQQARGKSACEAKAESMRMYTQFKSIGASRINKEISKLLEVDRKPLANPCL